jgi:stage II sporulation protein GA (sporulation sigma-E factor processing peptidase)
VQAYIGDGEFLVDPEIRYIDIIWLDNLIMNFLLLWGVYRFTKNEAPIWRLWASACLGAGYAVLTLLPGFDFLSHPIMKLALSIVMLLSAYSMPTLRDFIKLLASFYGATFIFGGAALGLHYFCSNSIGFENGVFYIRNFSVKVMFFSVVLVSVLCRTLWLLLQARIQYSRLLYKLEIRFDGTSRTLEALLDTGNELRDPVSHSPVMVVEFNEIMPLLPKDICEIFQEPGGTNLEHVTKVMVRSPWINRFRIIPFNALGNTCGMLIGYKPDEVKILMDDGWKEIKDVIVGIYNQKLSRDNDYHALINPQIIP